MSCSILTYTCVATGSNCSVHVLTVYVMSWSVAMHSYLLLVPIRTAISSTQFAVVSSPIRSLCRAHDVLSCDLIMFAFSTFLYVTPKNLGNLRTRLLIFSTWASLLAPSLPPSLLPSLPPSLLPSLPLSYPPPLLSSPPPLLPSPPPPPLLPSSLYSMPCRQTTSRTLTLSTRSSSSSPTWTTSAPSRVSWTGSSRASGKCSTPASSATTSGRSRSLSWPAPSQSTRLTTMERWAPPSHPHTLHLSSVQGLTLFLPRIISIRTSTDYRSPLQEDHKGLNTAICHTASPCIIMVIYLWKKIPYSRKYLWVKIFADRPFLDFHG